MTLSQAKTAIEEHLAQTLDQPEVSVDVYSYNSKVYYVITQGAGQGDGVARFPITGNETVLDAISQVNGLHSVASKKIWIARPGPDPGSCQILPVDWCAIAECASIESNYQVLPGDRIFIAEDKLVAFDNHLAKFIAPMERVFGFATFGGRTVQQLKFKSTNDQGNGGF